MNSRTPGPWAAIKWRCHAATSVVVDDSSVVTGKRVVAEAESEADARLIAAAPDLEEIVRTFDAYMGHAGEEAEQDSLNPIRALRWKAQQALQRVDGGVA